MILKDQSLYDSIPSINGVFYFLDYHPYRSGSNPNFNNLDKAILDLKKKNINVIFEIYKYIKNEILSNQSFVICTVPSHQVSSELSGIQHVAETLIRTNLHYINGVQCLKRITEINKLSSGGERNIDIHLNSIRIVNDQVFRGKEVLLLDDVATTGNSMRACKDLLINAGAKEVLCLAIAHTV